MALGVRPDEVLAGFISVGAIAKAPPPAKPVSRKLVWSTWSATLASGAPLPESLAQT
jgi:hypothetical protein